MNLQLAKRDIEHIDTDLVEFAALAHDLGHPPFGHNGEKALDELMLAAGGFEGNAQTLHILAAVERKEITDRHGKRSDAYGLDLMYRTLASILKYDREIPSKRRSKGVKKGYYAEERPLVQAIKKSVGGTTRKPFKTIECSIMDVADDIAYSTYDLEDSLHAQFVTPAGLLRALFHEEAIRKQVLRKTNKELAKSGHTPIADDDELFTKALVCIKAPTYAQDPKLPEETRDGWAAVETCARNVRFVESSVARTAFTAERVGRLINGIEFELNEKNPALSTVRLARDEMIDVELLKHLTFELVIRSPRLAIAERRGKTIVEKLFKELIDTDGALLHGEWRDLYKAASRGQQRRRVVCDFVAGMTDRYAVELHDALFGAGKTIFKPH